MFIFFWILLLFVSFFVVFVYGVLSELSQDILDRLLPNSSNGAILQKIWNKYDDISNTLLFFSLSITLWALLGIGTATGVLLLSIPYINNIFIALIGSSLVISINFSLYFLGKRFCEKTISKLAFIIYFITCPFASIINSVSAVLIKISGKDNDDVSVEEITDLVKEAHEDGSIDAGEFRLLTNVIKFGDVLVSDIMTPRIVMFSCPADMLIADVAKLPELQIYSRFPVWNGESIDDEVVGYVTTKEVFNAALNDKNNKTLKDLARPINFIPENAELRGALEELLRNKQHLYLVVDEYGGIEGLVTLEDVIETILGVEIIDEADKFADLRLLAKQKREMRIKTISTIYE